MTAEPSAARDFSLTHLLADDHAACGETVAAIRYLIDAFLGRCEIHGSAGVDALTQELRSNSNHKAPISFTEYLRYLEARILPYGINVASPRCLGHMAGGVFPFSTVLAQLITALNQNLVKNEASQAFTVVERQTIATMHALIYRCSESFYEDKAHNGSGALGIMTSGSTVANVTGLWIARNRARKLADGSFNRAVVVGSSLMHYSFDKAADLLGLGTGAVKRVPTDATGRVRVDLLRDTVRQCRDNGDRIIAVIGVAGSTDSGSIDRLDQVADVASESDAHFHVDAAWGAPLMFSRRHSSMMLGIERADSVAVDAHKQMLLPLGTSMLLLRDPEAAAAIEQNARYMLQHDSCDLGKHSLEGSRPGMALYLHAALHVIGRDQYERIIDSNIERARYFTWEVEQRPVFELLVRPHTNIVLYRYIPRWVRDHCREGNFGESDNRAIDAFNEELQQEQFRAGRSYVSRTLIDNTERYPGVLIVALRAVLANPATTEQDIAFLLDDQTRIAAAIEDRYEPRHSLDPASRGGKAEP